MHLTSSILGGNVRKANLRVSGGGVREHRRPYRALSYEDKVQLAIERFSCDNVPIFPTPIRELARRHQRAPSVISRAIVSAFREGLVEVQATGSALVQARRVEHLEHRLTQHFRHLHKAIVISSKDLPASEDSPRYLQYTDDVHVLLGQAMARLISDSPIIRDRDVVGIGGGRGVYHTIEALLWLPRIRASEVTIGSLTGFGTSKHYAKRKNVRLEADLHVGLLGPCFSEAVAMQFMNRSIVNSGPMTQQEWADTWIGCDLEQVPTVALLGAGTLTAGHQYFEQAAVPIYRRQPMFDPIRADLRMLVNISRAFASERYCPIGHIGDRLFFVPPSTGIAISTEAQYELKRLVAKINQHVCTLTESQLKKIGTIMLVAGSSIEAPAIETLLSNPEYRIRYLSTDEYTARRILAVIPNRRAPEVFKASTA
jgi:DNA-binding transcriptional regulator LsrR (DeoR family)